MTFWSHLFRVQLFRHFCRFFFTYVCKCVKTDPHSEGSEVFKIAQNQASSLLGCLGVPMATKMYPKDVKMMFRGVQNQFKTLLKTVNYEAKNASNYKTDKLNSELSAAFGYLAQ